MSAGSKFIDQLLFERLNKSVTEDDVLNFLITRGLTIDKKNYLIFIEEDSDKMNIKVEKPLNWLRLGE